MRSVPRASTSCLCSRTSTPPESPAAAATSASLAPASRGTEWPARLLAGADEAVEEAAGGARGRLGDLSRGPHGLHGPGHVRNLDVVGDHLGEGVGVGQRPGVVALDDLTLRPDRGTEGVERVLRDDAVLVTPEDHHRELTALELLELLGEIRGASQIGHLPHRLRVAN